MSLPSGVDKINPTARTAYRYEGLGIGAGNTLVEWIEKLTSVRLDSAHRILDVGFGEGQTLREASRRQCARVAGVDLVQLPLDVEVQLRPDEGETPVEIAYLDVSGDALPYEDNAFNIVTCTETIEHLANPLFAVSEMKRVLEPDGLLVMSFPRPEDNLGYDGGQHAHVYPGFLEQESYEIFMKQLYFHSKRHMNNGSSAWYAWRNYKGPGIVDVFRMIAGNYTEEQLYGMLPNA